jgi:hypothetical protein
MSCRLIYQLLCLFGSVTDVIVVDNMNVTVSVCICLVGTVSDVTCTRAN